MIYEIDKGEKTNELKLEYHCRHHMNIPFILYDQDVYLLGFTVALILLPVFLFWTFGFSSWYFPLPVVLGLWVGNVYLLARLFRVTSKQKPIWDLLLKKFSSSIALL